METSDCPGCRVRDARITKLEEQLLQLQGEVRDLKDKMKPPTPGTHAPLPPAPEKKPSGRKPGGQPGHPPHLKQLLPPERVKSVVAFIPEHCSKCQADLPKDAGADDQAPTRHQVAELPPMMAEITEYQGHYRTCPCCGEVNHTPIPAAISAHSVGERLTAVFAYMAGHSGMSKRHLEDMAENVFEVPIALGTIANLEQEVSAALAPAYQEVRAAIQEAPVKYVDETGWKLNGLKRWLWAAATTGMVAFVIHPLRSLVALKMLVGEDMDGVLCSDRWVVYQQWPDPDRKSVV